MRYFFRPVGQDHLWVIITGDFFVVVGTSMQVYPAAGLIDCVPIEVPKFIVDPHVPSLANQPNLYLYPEKATVGMAMVAQRIRKMLQ